MRNRKCTFVQSDIIESIVMQWKSESIPSIKSNRFATDYILYDTNQAAVEYCLDFLCVAYEIQKGEQSAVPKTATSMAVVDKDSYKLKYSVDGEMYFEPILDSIQILAVHVWK